MPINREHYDPVPTDEDCAQVGAADYMEKATAEADCFVAALRVRYADRPEGFRFLVRRREHDFGQYLEIEVVYNSLRPDHVKYFYHVDRTWPSTWNEATAPCPMSAAVDTAEDC